MDFFKKKYRIHKIFSYYKIFKVFPDSEIPFGFYNLKYIFFKYFGLYNLEVTSTPFKFYTFQIVNRKKIDFQIIESRKYFLRIK